MGGHERVRLSLGTCQGCLFQDLLWVPKSMDAQDRYISWHSIMGPVCLWMLNLKIQMATVFL